MLILGILIVRKQLIFDSSFQDPVLIRIQLMIDDKSDQKVDEINAKGALEDLESFAARARHKQPLMHTKY